MIINTIYETQKSSVAVACFLPGRAKDLSAPHVLDNLQACLMTRALQLFKEWSEDVWFANKLTGTLHSESVAKKIEVLDY